MPLCELSCIVLSARISPAGTLMAPQISTISIYSYSSSDSIFFSSFFLPFFFFALISKLPLIPSVPYLATLGPARALMETRCGTSLPARRCILWSIRWRGNATQKQHSEADALTCTRPMLTGSKKNQASQDLSFSPLIWDASPPPPDESMPSDLPFLTSLLSPLPQKF